MSSRAEMEIRPEELARRLAAREPIVLVDVRRQDEFDLGTLPGAVLIPLHELSSRLDELDPEAEIVAFCHHGIRSLDAVAILRAARFAKARSLAGGVESWSVRVDPTFPRY